jgi:hypothetical protein
VSAITLEFKPAVFDEKMANAATKGGLVTSVSFVIGTPTIVTGFVEISVVPGLYRY